MYQQLLIRTKLVRDQKVNKAYLIKYL